MVGRLTGKAVPILCQDHRDATSGHRVSHPVHSRPLEACSALSGVRDLLENLIALSGGILPQGLELLGEGVAASCLLVCGDAGVEYGPLGAVAVG